MSPVMSRAVSGCSEHGKDVVMRTAEVQLVALCVRAPVRQIQGVCAEVIDEREVLQIDDHNCGGVDCGGQIG